MEDLAVQVGLVDRIHINDRDRPDTGNGEIDGDGRAETPCSCNEDMGFLQLFLPLVAKEQDLPLVPFAFPFG